MMSQKKDGEMYEVLIMMSLNLVVLKILKMFLIKCILEENKSKMTLFRRISFQDIKR